MSLDKNETYLSVAPPKATRMRQLLRMTCLAATMSLGALCLLTGQAQAQRTPVGLDRLSVEAKVHMTVENAPGTPKDNAMKLANALSAAIGPVRQCYRKVTNDHLDLEGTHRLQVRIKAGVRKQQVKLLEDTVEHKKLARCVTKEIRRMKLKRAPRGATTTVFAVITYGADKAVQMGKKRLARAKAGSAHMASTGKSGGFEVSSRTAGGEVVLHVSAPAQESKKHVEAVHQGVRAAMPKLLDCRRKIAKRVSPEGEIVVDLKVRKNGKATARVTKSSVPRAKAAPNAKACAVAALRRARYRSEAEGPATLRIEFSAAKPTHPLGRKKK